MLSSLFWLNSKTFNSVEVGEDALELLFDGRLGGVVVKPLGEETEGFGGLVMSRDCSRSSNRLLGSPGW